MYTNDMWPIKYKLQGRILRKNEKSLWKKVQMPELQIASNKEPKKIILNMKDTGIGWGWKSPSLFSLY